MSHEHPSYFALDALRLGVGETEVAKHLEGCLRCQKHIAAVTGEPSFVPPHVASAASKRKWFVPHVWVAPALLMPALAALVLFVQDRDTYDVRSKGPPAVLVQVTRGGGLEILAGSVRPDEMLTLLVNGAGFRYITLLSDKGVLYEGPLAEGHEVSIPVRIRAAEVAESGRLEVIFSQSGEGPPDVYRARLTIPVAEP